MIILPRNRDVLFLEITRSHLSAHMQHSVPKYPSFQVGQVDLIHYYQGQYNVGLNRSQKIFYDNYSPFLLKITLPQSVYVG